MKFRVFSLLGALGLAVAVTAAPAAAATTSVPSQTTSASVLGPAPTGASDPAQGWGGWGYPWSGGAPSWMASRSAASDSSGSADDCGCMRHHGMGWGAGTSPMLGSGSPWWAGMPLSQISAATGGTWPWAYGVPLFLPPPRPPVPPLGISLFNIGVAQQGGLSGISGIVIVR